MIRISRDNYIAALRCRAFGQVLHSGNEGTGCVNDFGGTLLQLALHLRRDAMRPNDRDRMAVSFRGCIDRGYALFTESLHLLRVMIPRPERANWSAVLFQRVFDHLNGTLDAKTKPVFVS